MKLIVGNWKLNPKTLKEAQKLALALNKAKTKNKVVLCPPYLYLPLIKSKFELGSQDLFWQEQGAYTGQVSGSMLKQFKVKYAIIGHSEKREVGDTDQEINLKLKAAIANKIIPILCVGFGIESGEDDEEVMIRIQNQLELDLKDVDPSKVIVAYEPVWAIGSGKAASAEHAEKTAMFIRMKFHIKKVLYGGSTNPTNAKEFLSKQIDGLLVGGSSIKADDFYKMITL
ncbi:MAG: Triosephosphate isomerase [Candidatus Doudnabacteria bacterium]|nr:Triosephosphate isomerase [Candidatus Doudnabacteria bacterium]